MFQIHFVGLAKVSVETQRVRCDGKMGDRRLWMEICRHAVKGEAHYEQNELHRYPIAVNVRLLPGWLEYPLYQPIHDVSYGKSKQPICLI